MGLNHDERQIEELLRQHEALLITEHPHRKYRFPDGRKLVMAFTPGDCRAARNALAHLRRFLAVPRQVKKSKLDKKVRREVRRVLAERPLAGAETGPLRSLMNELLTKVKKEEVCS